MGKKLPEFVICRDTREKENNGWVFEEEEKKAGKTRVLGTLEECLSAGDYCIKDHYDLVVIERKQGFCELMGNMSPKDHMDRFLVEMEKLRPVKHKYIVVETSITKETLGLSIGQMYKGPPMKSVLKWLIQLEMEFGVVPIFAGDAGKIVARNIFDQIARKYL